MQTNHKIRQFLVLKVAYWALFVFCFLVFGASAFCQQLPYYTQFQSNSVFLNPAAVGTKRMIDARINYRRQWIGFDGAPVTQGISLNSRLFKGKMGLGVNYVNDETGPSKRTDLAFAYSYHIQYDDVELSTGIAYQMFTYMMDGTKLNLHLPIDNAADLTTTLTKKVDNASAGALLFNDRFHIGLGAIGLLAPAINFYQENDTAHKTNIKMTPHVYGSFGFNWSGQPDWIWENSLQLAYARANPMTIAYTLRLHYKEKMFSGVTIRLRDAIALHIGATIKEELQISYSYDIVTSSLRTAQSGSHEVFISWSSNFGKNKRNKKNNSRFRNQKYGFMF